MRYFLSIVLLLLAVSALKAQRGVVVNEERPSQMAFFKYPPAEKKERYRVAVLTPMYLDSLEWEKNLGQLPKFMMPGLDFYQGIEIAADTLRRQGIQMDIYVFDSRSTQRSVSNLIASDTLSAMDLIIGNASAADLKILADFAKKNFINFVSAVSPSDAGQQFNPYFTVLQPRLATHIEKIHRVVNMRMPEDNVVFLHRKIPAEVNALGYFKNDMLNKLPGRFQSMELKNDSIDMKVLMGMIDTNYQTTLVLGVLDASVTYKMLKQLVPYADRWGLKVFCMPTTEAVKALGKPDEFGNLMVYYTSAYLIDRITPASQFISKSYRERMGGMPSDVVFKGFESLYYFGRLLERHGVPFNEHLSDNAYSFITPYKIMPVREKGAIRFYENKFLYLIRYQQGIMTYE
ncbi:MAG: hypothetical protein FGM54_01720 [Chitinophagaceae bacterium]|nr:hypothetical protein [Chitinophagaceae bacterium]